MNKLLGGDALLRMLADVGSDSLAGFSGEDWARLVDRAIRHRCAPLLHRWLIENDESRRVPEPLIVRLRDEYLRWAARGVYIRRDLSRVLTALGEAGIPVVLLKGAYLAEAVYGDVALRPMTDLDLLVPKRDLRSANEVLIRLGYASTESQWVDYGRHHHLPALKQPGAITVELHGGLAPAGGPFEINVADAWRRARPVTAAGVPALALAPEDLVLHLCLHLAYNHQFQVPLLHVFDLALVLLKFQNSLDFGRISDTAHQDGRTRLVHGTFAVVEGLLGEAASFMDTASFASPREEDPIVRTIVDFLRWEGDRRLPTAYRRLGEQRGLRSKAVVLLRTIFPRRKEMRRIYRLREGSLRVYGCYLLRPVDLLLRRSGIALRLVLRRSDLGRRNDWERSRLEIHRWIEGMSGLRMP